MSHSRLLLHVARSFGGDHDAAMERYARILEQLRLDEFRKLRTYLADGRSEFSTWLVVVAQRICLDHRRHCYGRSRPTGSEPSNQAEDRLARHRLMDLITAEIDVSSLSDNTSVGPEGDLRLADMHRALESALAQLDARDRMLVKLRFEDELSMPEIARGLGLPTRFHAYRRLTQVLRNLRQTLQGVGVWDATP
jgi:RNA polymerase sigma factor (sigma-70 family)